MLRAETRSYSSIGWTTELPREVRRYMRCYVYEGDWIEHLVEGLVKAGFEPEA